jgi:N-acetyl-anhydromuramyl-L-alanine amidase AmpD
MIERHIDLIVVHATSTYATMDVGVDWIDRLHKKFGWKGCGYHFVIRRDGTVEAGRDVSIPGAHAKGFNANSIGICYAGGLDPKGDPEDNRTPEQKEAMRSILDTLTHVFPEAKVVGHRDLPEVRKACPCFDVKEWYYGED